MLVGPTTPYYGPVVTKPVTIPYTGSHFTAVTGLTLESLYTCQNASGALVDVVNARNLTAASTPVYRYVNAGKNGVRCDSAADGFAAAVNDLTTQSAIIGAIAMFPTSFASLPGIIGRSSDTTFPCFMIYKSNESVNYPTLLIRDNGGSNSVLLADNTANTVRPNVPVLYLAQLDTTADIGRLQVFEPGKRLVNQSASTASIGSLTGGSTPRFVVGTGPFTTGGVNMLLGFVAVGAQCEGSSKLQDIANRLGFGR